MAASAPESAVLQPGPGSGKGTLLFIAAYAATSVLSLAYVVSTGRLLDATRFGIANALIGILGLIGYLAGACQNAAAEAVAAAPRTAGPAFFIKRLSIPILAVGTVAALAAAPLLAPLGADIGAAVTTGLAASTMIVAALSTGAMAGRGDIAGQALAGLAGAAARIGAGVVLMLAGLGPLGALAGYLVGNLVSIGFGLRRAGAAPSSGVASGTGDERLAIKPRSVAIFVTAFVPFALDQWLVQSLAPAEGGPYAALTTVAKLVFFCTMPAIMIVFPRILATTGAQARMGLLRNAGAAVLLVSGCAGSALALAAPAVFEALFPGRFAAAAQEITVLAPGMVMFSVSILLVHALSVWQPAGLLIILSVPPAVGIALFIMRHDSLSAMAANLTLVYGLQLILLSAAVLPLARRAMAAGKTA